MARRPKKRPRQRRKPKGKPVAQTTAQTTAQNTVQTRVPVGTLVPQPHGGALRYGGTNAGGSGRPPLVLRQDLRQLLDKHGLKFVAGVLAGVVAFEAECPKCGHRAKQREKPTTADRLRAVELLARYGLGTRDELTAISPEVRWRVQRTVHVVENELPVAIRATDSPEKAAEWLVNRLGEVWSQDLPEEAR